MRAMLTSCLALAIIFAGFSDASELAELLKKLRSSDNTVRRQAAQELGELSTEEGKSAVSALIKALRDKDLFVRRYAVSALGKLGVGNKEAVTALFVATNDAKSEVRLAAIDALGNVGPGAADALTSILKDPTREPLLRKKAALSLGNIGMSARRALPTLTGIVDGSIKSPKMKKKEKNLSDDDYRTAAATALGKIAKNTDTKAIEALKSVSEGKQKNRALKKAASDALREITGEGPKKNKKK
jgi:HEAT repeat protein